MEIPASKLTVFSCCYNTVSLYADTTWPTSDGTSHVSVPFVFRSDVLSLFTDLYHHTLTVVETVDTKHLTRADKLLGRQTCLSHIKLNRRRTNENKVWQWRETTAIITGHCMMSSGHSNAPTDAGLVQNLQPKQYINQIDEWDIIASMAHKHQ